jgi:hypothetical protein
MRSCAMYLARLQPDVRLMLPQLRATHPDALVHVEMHADVLPTFYWISVIPNRGANMRAPAWRPGTLVVAENR